MPRPLRIEFSDAWYHVMNRGSNHQDIYTSNSDRKLFYTILHELVELFHVEIHAFCLMDNHYHILIKTPFANLSKAMRHLDGLYTQRFNRLVGRDGPLFRGRYKAILVDSDEYLLQVSRYIHLNPVIANICKDPSEFKWSSYLSYIDKKQLISWLNTECILNQMTGNNARHSYLEFIMQGVDDDTRKFYSKKKLATIFGRESFIKEHMDVLKSDYVSSVLTDINRTKIRPSAEAILKNVEDYFSQVDADTLLLTWKRTNIQRLVTIYLLRKLGHLSHEKIATLINIKPKSVSSLLHRTNKLFMNVADFSCRINEIMKLLSTC